MKEQCRCRGDTLEYSYVIKGSTDNTTIFIPKYCPWCGTKTGEKPKIGAEEFDVELLEKIDVSSKKITSVWNRISRDLKKRLK